MPRILALAALSCLALATAPAAANAGVEKYKTNLNAGTNLAPTNAPPVSGADAPDSNPHVNRSPDLGVKPTPQLARRAKNAWASAAKEETFQDEHGHAIHLATDNDSVNLAAAAELLAATYHSDEISLVRVIVTSNAGVTQFCGAEAVACYAPDDPDRSNDGTMVISYEDEDIVQTVFHEYGHHMDNQLYNLNERIGCRFDNDGSRRWFFTRDVEANILESTSCSPDSNWENLLGELFAEDFAQLTARVRGIQGVAYDSRMPVPPPSDNVLGALKADIDRPFVARTKRLKGRFRRRVVRRTINVTVPSFLDIRGSSGIRRARLSGCDTQYENVYFGRCKVSFARKGRSKRYRIAIEIN
jgi:hypothetical protein